MDADRAIIDLALVNYIDSTGVTELLLAHKERRDSGGEPIRLVVPKGSHVARLIELTGLDKVFPVFLQSLDSARLSG